MSDQSLVSHVGSQLAYIILVILYSTLTFLLWILMFFIWETRTLKKLRDSFMVTQIRQIKVFCWNLLVLDLFREINFKFQGGVMCYSFCNFITCWIVGTQILDHNSVLLCNIHQVMKVLYTWKTFLGWFISIYSFYQRSVGGPPEIWALGPWSV